MLNKEFKRKDVERMRNLIKGKGNARTVSGVGFAKKTEFHEEGDIWEEDGRQWTIKNGIKQNITKLDAAKKAINLPLFCPSCNGLMKHKYDKAFYGQYNRCYGCQIDFETELRKLGLWEEYEKNIINSDVEAITKEYEIWMDEQINSDEQVYFTEAGDAEKWTKGDKAKLIQSKEEVIKYLQSLKR
jgi:Pyruvate/2-oxoacid:ferredoxin oxidoreductase delta subunit